nr:carboxymuconolactone decarboxylase family protein [Pseudomonas sp.]
MARIELASSEPQDPALQAIYNELRAARGQDFEIPNLYRVLGNAPAMLRAWLDFAWPLRSEPHTSRAVRELAILRGAQVSGAQYEWVRHVPLALQAGVTQAQIDALESWRDSPLFTEQDKAVLRMAEEVTQGPAASAESIEALKTAGFSDSDVVELVLTSSFYVCVSRFLQSMDIELE